MATETKALTLRGLDGFAGFRHGPAHTVEISKEDDGSGDKLLSVPHAPGRGGQVQHPAVGGVVE